MNVVKIVNFWHYTIYSFWCRYQDILDICHVDVNCSCKLDQCQCFLFGIVRWNFNDPGGG